MDHTPEEWQALQIELELLREQNQTLKRAIQDLNLRRQMDGEANMIRSSLQPRTNKQSNSLLSEKCIHCNYCRLPQKSKQELVTQLQSWSQKLSVNLFKKKQPQLKRASSSEPKDSPDQQLNHSAKSSSLLQKICLFGPNREKTTQMSSKRLTVPHQLYFPLKDPFFSIYQSYGCSLYPQEVDVKVVREKNKSIEIDRIVFRKSLKHSDCKLVIFQSKEEFCLPLDKIRRDFNPFSTVYCVSLEFADYLYSDKPYHGFIDRSISLSEDRYEECLSSKSDKFEKTDKIDESLSLKLRRESSTYGQSSIYKSNFCISVMSYYPFIDFFCHFLLQLANYIKIKRIQQHSKHPQNYQKIDIRYVVQQLTQAGALLKPLYTQKIDYGAKLQFHLGEAVLKLGLDNPKQQMSRDWAYRMLRLLDRQNIYQIYCLVMQQQSLCFFSQNSYILTFMIYLFVGLLIHPFSYPHTIVSSVFEIDHLQTPFIAVMGLNKPNKWLQQNQEFFFQKITGKILIHLQQEEIKIKTKKKQKVPKSQRLRKIFGNFYKRVQKLQGSGKRKDILTREITKAQNDITQTLLCQLQTFYNEQLLRYMPNREIIESIRRQLSATSDNQTSVSVKLIKTIEQYIIQSRKNIERDPVIDMLLQKQIFSVYLTIVYDIV